MIMTIDLCWFSCAVCFFVIVTTNKAKHMTSTKKRIALNGVFDSKNITPLPFVAIKDTNGPDRLLKRCALELVMADTSTIVWERGDATPIDADPVGRLFIDNFVLFAVLDNKKPAMGKTLTEKEFIKSVMSSIHAASNHLGLSIKKIIRIPKPQKLIDAVTNLISNTNTASHTAVYFFKVKMADGCGLQDTLDALRAITENNKHTHLHDIDNTQDMAGTLPCEFERMMSEYTVEPGDRADALEKYWRRESFDGLIPVDNNRHVGLNCYTFLAVDSQHNQLRHKAYNKFAQLIQSHSVRTQKPGCHLKDIINNTSDEFNAAILDPRTQANGLTRIESTYYGQTIPTVEQLTAIHESFASKVRQGRLVSTPIREQWAEVCRQPKASVYFVDVHHQTLSLVRWIDACTGKMNGFGVDKPASLAELHDTIATTCFNGVPIHVFLLDYAYTNDEGVRFDHKGLDFSAFRTLHMDSTTQQPVDIVKIHDVRIGVLCLKKPWCSPQQINGSARSRAVNPLRGGRRLNEPSDVGLTPQPTFEIVMEKRRIENKANLVIDPIATHTTHNWLKSRYQNSKKRKKRKRESRGSETNDTTQNKKINHEPLASLMRNNNAVWIAINGYEQTTKQTLTIAVDGHDTHFKTKTPALVERIKGHFADHSLPLMVILTGVRECYDSARNKYMDVEFMTTEQQAALRARELKRVKKRQLSSLACGSSNTPLTVVGYHTTRRHNKDVMLVSLHEFPDVAFYVKNPNLVASIEAWFADHRLDPFKFNLTGTNKSYDKNRHACVNETFELPSCPRAMP